MSGAPASPTAASVSSSAFVIVETGASVSAGTVGSESVARSNGAGSTGLGASTCGFVFLDCVDFTGPALTLADASGRCTSCGIATGTLVDETGGRLGACSTEPATVVAMTAAASPAATFAAVPDPRNALAAATIEPNSKAN